MSFIGEAESGFDNVISDECTMQLMTHRRFSCRKAGEPKKKKKVLVLNAYGWAVLTCVVC